jgi:hypothetical protein
MDTIVALLIAPADDEKQEVSHIFMLLRVFKTFGWVLLLLLLLFRA